ncbi:MAG: thioredoxin family protein [Candidatus Eisenbacteria bacterium]|uniref:Thioredoxin family protein n=1 Tax=Eiseniibacteriota bacterium TaxID=2212470 RepID=A0A933WAY2_UNCEI|nr:thioredoxin family protein [Candidatus Eisenbacteria bacterium]
MPQTDSGAPKKQPARFDASWLALIAAALLLAYIASRVWQNDHPAAPAQQAEALGWVEIAQATNVAKQTGKPVMYDFSADWCQPCQMLKREVFDNPVHAKALEASIVPVKVIDRVQEQGQNPPDIAELQQRFAVDGFPTLVVVDPASGRSVKTVGFMGAEETVAWAKQAANTVRLGVNPDGTPVR